MATLTTTGNANLTSSTNWSPAQTPVAGDDLIVNGAHTLTLDDDLVFNSVTFQNAGARLAISGTTRVVGSTTGWNVLNVNLSAVLITTAIPSGTSLTLRGTWRSSGTNGGISGIANSTGGNLTLATIGDDPAGVLFEMPNVAGATRVVTASWTGGTLTTIGRFDLPTWTAASTIATMSGGSWSHTNTGTSFFGIGGHLIFSGSGTSLVNWSGGLESASTSASALFTTAGSGSSQLAGSVLRTGNAASVNAQTGGLSAVLLNNGAGTVNITGKLACLAAAGNATIITSGIFSSCRINWKNQSLNIASDEAVIIMNGANAVFDLTDLQITNAGRFVYVETGSAQAVVDSNTLITNTTPSAQAAVVSASGALDGKIINLASDAPTLPSVEDVAAGVSYGYTASPLTGTGLIIDPAVLASSVGAALDNISATALARFVTVDTGETSAATGSVASFGGGGGGATAIEIADEVQTRTIARVTLVDTCTANTDMRGTDNALLASSYTAPANSDIAAIKAKTDNLPNDPATIAKQDEILGAIGDIDCGGGGGGGTAVVNVLPAIGISADRSPGVTLKAFVGETITQSITLYQTNGTTPIVLTGKTLVIVFETRQGQDVATVPNSGITVSGDDDNVVTFNYPSAATSQERVLKFALRDAGSPNTVYLQGLLSVQRAPKVDV